LAENIKFNSEKHHRRSIRLPNYDYSQSGIYFVTICTHQKLPWFGEIDRGKMFVNQIGNIVVREWLKSSQMRLEIELDEWILMPNHLHGIVIINKNNCDRSISNMDENLQGTNLQGTNLQGASLAPLRVRKSRSLSSFIGGFKSAVTKRVRQASQISDLCVWQRNYYESVIRDERQLNHIQQYIVNNPFNWDEDVENNHKKSINVDFQLDLPF
jgi:putative transposase